MGKEYYFFDNIKYNDVEDKTDIEVEHNEHGFFLQKDGNYLKAVVTTVGSYKNSPTYFDTLWANISNDAEPILSILKETLGTDYIDDEEFEERIRSQG